MSNNDSSVTNTVAELTPTGNENAPSESNPNYADTLVGEGRKYEDIEALAQAYSHADVRIEGLKEELSAKTQSEAALQEVLDFVRASNTETVNSPEPANNAAPLEDSPESVDIDAKVNEVLAQRELSATYKANSAKAISLLTEKHGDKVIQDTVRKMIVDNPAQEGNINNLGNKFPDDLVTLIESHITTTNASPNSPGDDGRAGSRIATDNYELTWTQCRELKKSSPGEYNSMSHRALMSKMTAQHGSKWFNT